MNAGTATAAEAAKARRALPSDLFIGAELEHRTVDGRMRRRAYLDSAATSLPLRAVVDGVQQLLPELGNTHSRIHFSARLSQRALTWARARILEFVGASAGEYDVVFCGQGTTAAINRFATKLALARPDRDVVLVSAMEHHSNDLPHRRTARVEHIPLATTGARGGGVSLPALDELFERHRGRVRYSAITAASNVTGVVTPIYEIAARCKSHGVPLLVDGAAYVAHRPMRLSGADRGAAIDALAFSGHKLYAPMSPGVLVIRRELLAQTEPVEFGGGMVDEVTLSQARFKASLGEREHAGSTNVCGALMIGLACEWLATFGMERVVSHEQELMRYLLEGLCATPGVRCYGPMPSSRDVRVGTATFNVADIPHGLAAAVLNDVHNVAVRNECFCAQPYVRQLLHDEFMHAADGDDLVSVPEELAWVEQRRGMLRVSFGLHNTRADVDQLLEGVRDLQARRRSYELAYTHLGRGTFERREAIGQEAGVLSRALCALRSDSTCARQAWQAL